MTCCPPFNAKLAPVSTRKSEDEDVAVKINWLDRPLSSDDIILSSQWSVRPPSATNPIVLSGAAIVDQETSVVVSGGEHGQLYEIVNVIITDSGETLSQVVQMYISGEPTIYVYYPCQLSGGTAP